MPTVQIPTKLRRNAPCHCGSGRKFKKCCLVKEQKKMEAELEAKKIINAPPSGLKNEFRDEIRDPYAGIPEDELVRRDQHVLLKELKLNELVMEVNRMSIESVLESAKVLRVELLALPKSPYREECIVSLSKMIENNLNALKTIRPPANKFLAMLALEELLESPTEDEVKKLAKPFGPMISPKVEENEDRREPMSVLDELDEAPGKNEDP